MIEYEELLFDNEQELFDFCKSHNKSLIRKLEDRDQQISYLQAKVKKIDKNYGLAKDKYVMLLKDYEKLKQQLRELPKKIVGEIKKVLRERCDYLYLKDKSYPNLLIDWHDIVPILDNLLKKYEEKKHVWRKI